MPETKPIIVLKHPQLGENIGMVARAMLNFGLTELRLVNPREEWPNNKAISTASGALEVIENTTVYETLNEAVHDVHMVYGTTARGRDMVNIIHTPATAAQDIQEQHSTGKKTAIVFGAERTGLENDDIALCNALITYPTNPDFSSLNLAQAVLLMSYELMRSENETSDIKLKKGNNTPFATRAEFDNFLHRLYDDLEDKGFFKTEKMKPVMKQNIESMLVRMQMTEQELNTLHGIIAAMKRK